MVDWTLLWRSLSLHLELLLFLSAFFAIGLIIIRNRAFPLWHKLFSFFIDIFRVLLTLFQWITRKTYLWTAFWQHQRRHRPHFLFLPFYVLLHFTHCSWLWNVNYLWWFVFWLKMKHYFRRLHRVYFGSLFGSVVYGSFSRQFFLAWSIVLIYFYFFDGLLQFLFTVLVSNKLWKFTFYILNRSMIWFYGLSWLDLWFIVFFLFMNLL